MCYCYVGWRNRIPESLFKFYRSDDKRWYYYKLFNEWDKVKGVHSLPVMYRGWSNPTVLLLINSIFHVSRISLRTVCLRTSYLSTIDSIKSLRSKNGNRTHRNGSNLGWNSRGHDKKYNRGDDGFNKLYVWSHEVTKVTLSIRFGVIGKWTVIFPNNDFSHKN